MDHTDDGGTRVSAAVASYPGEWLHACPLPVAYPSVTVHQVL
jgi:hypothetical protein